MNYTKMFLENIEELFPNHCLYSLKERGSPLLKYIEKNNQIETDNNEKSKRGIYFTPNWDFREADWIRKKLKGKNLYTCFVDIDHVNEEDIEKKLEEIPDAFEPSIIIRTWWGLHLYWLLDKPYSYSESLNMWDSIQLWLCNFFSWDKAARDWARLLRLPWTRYWKDNKWDKIIQCIGLNKNKRYSLQKLFNNFNPVEEEVIKNKKIRSNLYNNELRTVYDKINSLPVEDVLYDISGGKYFCEWDEIYEEGKKTRWYKRHPSWNYIHTFSPHDERPIWEPFAVAKKIKWSSKETFDYFQERRGVEYEKFLEQKWKVTIIDETKETKTVHNTRESCIEELEENKDYSVEVWTVTLEFKVKNRSWYVFTDDGASQIIDWYLRPIGFFEDRSGINSYIVRYINQNWHQWILLFKQLWKKWELEKVLSEVWITFLWTAAAKWRLISLIQSTNERYKEITSLWIYSKKLIINRWWKYLAKEWDTKYFVNISKLLENNKWESEEIIKIWTEKTIQKVKETINKFKESYNELIAVSLFISYAMSLFMHELRWMWFSIPIINLVWMTQSGKTTMRRMAMDAFWINKKWEIQASTTQFVVMNLLKHNLPINVWEFSNNEINFDWDNMMKNNYDWVKNERGRADQTVTEYQNNAMLFVDWETRTLKNSVYSRSITLFLNPKYTKKLQKIENINKYFIDNFECIYKIKNIYKEERGKLKEEFIGVDVTEKERFLDNYSLLLSFAKSFNLYEETKNEIKDYLKKQIKLKWEDNLNKTIKQSLVMAIIHSLPAELIMKNDVATVRIEIQMDPIKYNPKVDDLLSNIQLVNHHFWYQDAESETLYIPIEFIFKNKTLHLSFNRFLDYISKHTNYDHCKKITKVLIQYWHHNWYTRSIFRNEIVWEIWERETERLIELK